jgi:fructose-bisphosphate aldolase class 1
MSARMLLVAVVLVFLGIYFCNPSQVLSGDDAQREESLVEMEITQSPELLERQNRLKVRMAYKELLIDGLLSHEFSLKQVAQEFVRINSEDDVTMGMMRLSYPGATDEEKAAHNVADFVNTRNSLSTCDRDAIVANLKAEIDFIYCGR